MNLEYSLKDAESGKDFLFGVAGNFKRLIPDLQSDSGYKTTEGINSVSGTAYVKLGFKKVVFKLAGFYGQSMFDYTMIGGYVRDEITDASQALVSYRNLTTFSSWFEVMSTGKKIQTGLFLGWSKNMGAGDIVIGPFYARGQDIASLYRISPRFVYNAGKFRIAPEIEYTVANYGKIGNDAKVFDPEPVGNIRFLVGVFYYF